MAGQSHGTYAITNYILHRGLSVLPVILEQFRRVYIGGKVHRVAESRRGKSNSVFLFEELIMNFKKYLTAKDFLRGQDPLEAGGQRRPTVAFGNLPLSGQAALEYFIIFSMIVFLTILSLSSFDESVGDSAGNFSKEAISRILR